MIYIVLKVVLSYFYFSFFSFVLCKRISDPSSIFCIQRRVKENRKSKISGQIKKNDKDESFERRNNKWLAIWWRHRILNNSITYLYSLSCTIRNKTDKKTTKIKSVFVICIWSIIHPVFLTVDIPYTCSRDGHW